jgi:uncharacterized protein YuzE
MWTCYENDVAYILLADTHPGEAAIRIVQAEARWQQDLPNSIKETVKSLMLEFDSEDRLIAIEVWGASAALPKSFIEMTARETRPKPIERK